MHLLNLIERLLSRREQRPPYFSTHNNKTLLNSIYPQPHIQRTTAGLLIGRHRITRKALTSLAFSCTSLLALSASSGPRRDTSEAASVAICEARSAACKQRLHLVTHPCAVRLFIHMAYSTLPNTCELGP